MEKEVKLNISIEGIQILTFSSFDLYQRFNEHHTFELRFNQDQMEAPGTISLNKSKDFIGKSITVEFGDPSGLGNLFTGVITKVEITQSHGFMGNIIITGASPTILIDRGPDLGSYLDKNLIDIISEATKDVPANDLYMQVNPSRKAPIDYLIQYRESDFAFINRLSMQYHEWFFYDGRQLVFGKPDKQKKTKLIYGRDLTNIQYGMQIAPLKYKKFAYNPKQDELLTATAGGQASGSADLTHAITASNAVYNKSYNQPLITRADNASDIESFVKNEQDAIKSNLLKISCTGDNPQVSIGGIADISISRRKENDFFLEDLGEFLVTSIYHHFDGVGHYQNSFEAVSADTERIPVNLVQSPQPDMQLANVTSNDDPDGNGRVKVKFKWECSCNDMTEWLRVITPDAGNSEQVSKNRGFVFIPEVGDQVLIGFEEGNIARPIVMGSVFHGKSSSGGSTSNNSKSITSKSGHTFRMDDGAGITLMDKSKLNHITIDGEEVVTVTAKTKIILQVTGGGSITIEGSDITLKGENIKIDASGTFEAISKGNSTLKSSNAGVTVEAHQTLSAEGKVSATLKGKAVEIHASNDTVINGTQIKVNC